MERSSYVCFKVAVAHADYNSNVWWDLNPWINLDLKQMSDIVKVLKHNKCVHTVHVYGKVFYVFPSGAWFRRGYIMIVGTPMAQQFPVKQL